MKFKARASAVGKATAAWGAEVPDWVRELAEYVDRHESQSKAAAAIGYSTAVVCNVLANAYRGDMGKVEDAVRSGILEQTASCPVLGEITKFACLYHQARPFATTSSQRVRIYRACRGECAHSRLKGGGNAQ